MAKAGASMSTRRTADIDDVDLISGSEYQAEAEAAMLCPVLSQERCAGAGICEWDETTKRCKANENSEVLANLKHELQPLLGGCMVM